METRVFWLGLSDMHKEGDWQWVDGRSLSLSYVFQQHRRANCPPQPSFLMLFWPQKTEHCTLTNPPPCSALAERENGTGKGFLAKGLFLTTLLALRIWGKSPEMEAGLVGAKRGGKGKITDLEAELLRGGKRRGGDTAGRGVSSAWLLLP